MAELIGTTLAEVVGNVISQYPWADMKKTGGIAEAIALAAQRALLRELQREGDYVEGDYERSHMSGGERYFGILEDVWQTLCAKLGVEI